jgi:hypothetical protein
VNTAVTPYTGAHSNVPAAIAQTAVEIRSHVNRIQEVMTAVFIENVHFGTIPGTGDKRSLYKPGAEVICMTFRIAPRFRVEDLSTTDEIRYRVTCEGVHQTTGTVLGEGVGEASTGEEKYKWRAAVVQAEWEDTPVDRRRLKYKKSDGRDGKDHYTISQIRTEPADLANTVLKMACKRALVAMCLVTTAASDCFTQDLEDLPEELRGATETDESGEPRRTRQRKPATRAPQGRSGGGGGGGGSGFATEPQVKLLGVRLRTANIPEEIFCDEFKIDALAALPFGKVNDALEWIKNNAAQD